MLKNNQSGAVALLTVIFIAILLSILTASLISLVINEQRQATDDNLTKRAYYAAESGVEEAKLALEKWGKDPTFDLKGGSCEPAIDPDGNGIGDLITDTGVETAYTCQRIDTEITLLEDYLEEGETLYIPLRSVTEIKSVKISWYIRDDLPNGDGINPSLRGINKDLPTHSAWGNAPAMLRANIFSINSASITRGDLLENNRVAFLNPANNTESPEDLNAIDAKIRNGTCNAGVALSGYVCEYVVNIPSDATRDYFLRLKTIYKASHVKIELFGASNASGSALVMDGVGATIDVTGRAGDVFRRVQVTVLLDNQDIMPDYAILSAEDLCKNFVITDDTADFGVANPSIMGSCNP
jgi:hypothetical protein